MHRFRAIAIAGLLVAATTVRGEPPQPVDKSGGEEEQIRERVEWFERTRGLDAQPDARRLRANAVAALRARLARGVPSLLANQTWLSMGPAGMTMLNWRMGSVAGRVSALGVDPGNEDTLYLGAAAGGLWKSVDGGASWRQLFDDIGTLSVGSVLLEAGAPDHVWVGTGEAFAGCADYFGMGLFRSTDGGATFEPRNGSGDDEMPLSFVTAIAQSPADKGVLLVGGKGHCNDNGSIGTGGIYRTLDGGETWERTFSAPGVLDIVFAPNNGRLVYAAIRARGIYESTDAGRTWRRFENGLPFDNDATYSRLAVAPSDPTILYALIGPANGASLQLYRSADAGTNWALVNANACEGQCSYNLTLDVHPTNPDRVLVGTIRPALSIDGGTTLTPLTATWGTQQSVHQDIHIVQFSRNDGQRFWVGSDGGLWRSDDGGGHFDNLNANLEITQFYDVAIDPRDPEHVFGGAQDNSSSRRAGEDGSWDVTAVTGDGFMNAIDPAQPDRVFQTSYPNGGPALFLSTSGGAPNSFRWVSQTGTDGREPFPWVTPLVAAAGSVFVASNRVYRAPIGNSAAAYVWSPASAKLTGTSVSASVSVLASAAPFAAQDGRLRLYAGTSNGVVATTADAFATEPLWTAIGGNYPNSNVSDIAVDPLDETRVFVTRSVFTAPQLLGSSGGGNLVALGEGLPGVPANSVAIDPLDSQRVFVGTDIGVYVSEDGGVTFEPFMAGLPLGMVVMDLEVSASPHVLVAGTYGRGAWKIALDAFEDDTIFRDGFDAKRR